MRLEGKQALVAGRRKRGIGRAIALVFGREGANVAINYNCRADEAMDAYQLVREGKLKGRAVMTPNGCSCP